MPSVGRVTVSLRRSIIWSSSREFRQRSAATGAKHFRNQESELQRLGAVEPRVAHRLVTVLQTGLVEGLATTQALGHVTPGQLDVHATGPGTERMVHLEEPAHLADHVVEV